MTLGQWVADLYCWISNHEQACTTLAYLWYKWDLVIYWVRNSAQYALNCIDTINQRRRGDGVQMMFYANRRPGRTWSLTCRIGKGRRQSELTCRLHVALYPILVIPDVLLAQFSLYVHKSGLKPDSFHFNLFDASTHPSDLDFLFHH